MRPRAAYEPEIDGGKRWWYRELRYLESVPVFLLFVGVLAGLLGLIFVLEAFIAKIYSGPGSSYFVSLQMCFDWSEGGVGIYNREVKERGEPPRKRRDEYHLPSPRNEMMLTPDHFSPLYPHSSSPASSLKSSPSGGTWPKHSPSGRTIPPWTAGPAP